MPRCLFVFPLLPLPFCTQLGCGRSSQQPVTSHNTAIISPPHIDKQPIPSKCSGISMDKFKFRFWLWWLTQIVLLLRCEAQLQIDVRQETTSTYANETAVGGRKDAEQLGIPRCDSHYDCVFNGYCIKDSDGYGRCLCPKSCPSIVPATCRNRKFGSQCLMMDAAYQARFSLANPSCYQGLCVCPPMFDQILVGVNDPPLRLNATLLPSKCDRRELAVIGHVYPSPSVYKGSDATLFCCINVDPQGFIDASAVMFLQNTTFMREATKHPFKEQQTDRIACWELEIKNAQLSDSGTYTCLVTSLAYHGQPPVSANYTINFEVKEHEKRHHHWFKRPQKIKSYEKYDKQKQGQRIPRMIKNLKVTANEKSANVTWDVEDGQNEMAIHVKLLRRTDTKGQTVFERPNSSSPVVIDNLRPATPYTLFVSGSEGSDAHATPFELTEHFTTLETKPLPPNEEGVRVLNSGTSLICEVEWKSPPITNGRITKYYVRVVGSIRRPRPDGQIVADHYPSASEQGGKCANWDSEERLTDGINPVDFSTEFLSCKYGPLKPNRNYTVTVWAENNAGRSSPKIFSKHCTTPYAEPEQVEEPTTSAANVTTFNLNFAGPPDDTNGPISCYYIAIVPLHANVSIDALPPPHDIIMDNTAKVFHNNLQDPSLDKKRYFAYVAESYRDFPERTVIGDGSPLEGIEPCNVLYLSRYKAEDSALRTGLKYTGFLIVRVDKEDDDGRQTVINAVYERKPGRGIRQLHLSGPAYGYSSYFKPVYLDVDDNSSALGKGMIIFGIFLLFCLASTLVGVVFLHRSGHLSSLSGCPFFASLLEKDVTDRAPLKHDYSPIAVDDLPSEYIIRHRDSDFLFAKEYEAIPHYSLPSTSSERRENTNKNRYNDIKAFDESRVKLKKINGDEHSDYINANFIKSWNGRKTFIASQAPLDLTIVDFWRMVWEQESYLVIMVANLMEKNRVQCSKYWPDDMPQRYGDILVTPAEATYYADYAVRTFEVTNTGSSRFSPSRSEFNGSIDSHPDSEYANVPSTRNGRAIETSFGGKCTFFLFKNLAGRYFSIAGLILLLY
ncbi:hypothetical protein WR25_16591 [Diploscapter pachys]|uniref:Protein-tyrosine-phosphatase n=1 Tax=Diploscapter pachys TaxID=2018661 RepID=A0A2A2KTW1_9BILA|nr:hypothetical protein WR25_16591 [Diploscapter pachys]